MFIIEIAGLHIAVDHIYGRVARLCHNYIASGSTYDFMVRAGEEDISGEIKAAGRKISPAVAETACIYRAICERLPEYGAYMLHAAAVEYGGRAYAIAAASGTGKSTHARMWTLAFGKAARIINGDKPIVRWSESGARIYGTPWCGKEGLGLNTSAPLAGICYLQRGEDNEIWPAGSHESLKRLIRQVYIPRSPGRAALLLSLLDRTVREIPAWVLACNISPEAAITAYEAMKNRAAEL
ncbi:MAG: hypothetical protein GX057_04855 [Clostridiales bacterium]|nr:hypothetical protein [Clostridiales bacterium]